MRPQPERKPGKWSLNAAIVFTTCSAFMLGLAIGMIAGYVKTPDGTRIVLWFVLAALGLINTLRGVWAIRAVAHGV